MGNKYQRSKGKKLLREQIEEGMLLYPPFKYLIEGYPYQHELNAFEEKYRDIDVGIYIPNGEVYTAA